MNATLSKRLQAELDELQQNGLYKRERVIAGPQRARIKLDSGQEVINLCANNYLGLADHPEILKAAHEAIDKFGFGMASVRFICGTQTLHKELEEKLSRFLGTEDTILFPSCFDANGGIFECLLDAKDAVISDSLNHASIIDGIRLCKAERFRFQNGDMNDLEDKLKLAKEKRTRLIVTDGVFSMDGTIANLPDIKALADKYDALVMVDDAHATGFLGPRGRGTPEYHGLHGEIDILTGTLGKALGGAAGGYVSGKKEIVGWLRQRARPYLFSNSVAPVIVNASLKALELLERSTELRDKLWDNTLYFYRELNKLGLPLKESEHPIVPIMLGDAKRAGLMAEHLLAEGVYVIAFSYPVVPKGQARIRTQMSAALEQEDIDHALRAFYDTYNKLPEVA